MSATISTEFLLRVAQATPEQRAAIERILAGEGAAERGGVGAEEDVRAMLLRIEGKLDALKASRKGGAEHELLVSEAEAGRVFLLMKRLEGAPKERKAPIASVFRLLVLNRLSQRETAARCGCAESLISVRVAAIEKGFGMSIERLRNFASELLSLESAAKGERAHKKKHGRPDAFEAPDGSESDEEAEEQCEGEEEPWEEEEEG